MKNTKKLWITGLMTISLLGLCACGKKNEQPEMNIGYFNNVTHPQALLMKADNSLQDTLGEDVKVNWTAFNAGPAEVEALFAEDIDIGYIGPGPAINANTKSKGDVKILSGATKGGAILVKREGVVIENVKDLSGKTVAIPQIGNTQHLCLLQLLSENGLKPVTGGGDVNVTAVANADVANMMNRGDIDAALVTEPWGATLLEQGAELVLDFDEIYMQGNYDVAVVVVRKEFMEEYPNLVDAFLQAHEKASLKIVEDKDTALATINKELEDATGKSLSKSVIEEAFLRIVVDTKLNKESVMGFATMSEEQEFIAQAPAQDDLFVE